MPGITGRFPAARCGSLGQSLTKRGTKLQRGPDRQRHEGLAEHDLEGARTPGRGGGRLHGQRNGPLRQGRLLSMAPAPPRPSAGPRTPRATDQRIPPPRRSRTLPDDPPAAAVDRPRPSCHRPRPPRRRRRRSKRRSPCDPAAPPTPQGPERKRSSRSYAVWLNRRRCWTRIISRRPNSSRGGATARSGFCSPNGRTERAWAPNLPRGDPPTPEGPTCRCISARRPQRGPSN